MLFRSHRKDTTKIYDAVLETQLTSPVETGVYQLLTRPTKFVDVLVITSPKTIGKGDTNICTVVRTDGSGYVNIVPSALCVKPLREQRVDYLKWFKEIPTALENLSTDSIYVIVAEDGSGTIPFRVEKKATSNGVTEYFVSACTSTSYEKGLLVTKDKKSSSCYTTSCADYGFIHHDYRGQEILIDAKKSESDFDRTAYDTRRIVISKSSGCIRQIGDSLFVSPNCKAFKINTKSLYGDQLGYSLGTMTDVEMEI